MTNELIPVESINAIEVFTGDKLPELLARIRSDALSIVPDVTTLHGRKEIASIAYKVARSKTTIDDAGKLLVSEWKRQAGEVDAARKVARDTLDKLRDEVRAPLDAYDAEQKRISDELAAVAEAAERSRIEEIAAAERARVAEIERKEAELRAREEAIAASERKRVEREAAEQAERERIAREEQSRKEAEERATRKAQEAVEAAERESAAVAERARLAAEQAERDKAEAVRQAEQRARDAAAKVERDRLAEEQRIAREQAAREADREHRKAVNNAALAALTANGIDEDIAKKVIVIIASGEVPAITIRY